MIPGSMLPFANHLWQSTLFAIPVWLLVLTLRKNRAAVRHRLWLAASVKFLIPFSLLVGIGSHFQWQAASINAPSRVSMIVESISQPFTAPSPSPDSLKTKRASWPGGIPGILLSIWTCGFVLSLFWWFIRWGQVRATMRRSTPLHLDVPIRVMSCLERLEPGVFGIFRPVLLLPEGIAERLSPAQLQAVVNHELCHVRRRDNMSAAIHMFVEALFWFHPLVWWIKIQLINEQERACDEEVLRLGGDPQVYAESILKICEFYLTSPLICVSGISGSNLKKRIEEIMKNRISLKLSFSKAILLVVAALVVLAGPIMIGIATQKVGVAQFKPSLGFVASPVVIGEEKPANPETAQLQIATAPQGALRGSPGTFGLNSEYRILSIDIRGFQFLPDNVLRSTLGMATGDIYSDDQLRRGFENLRKLYGSSGYINFIPDPVFDFDEQRKLVRLTINIDEGRQFTVNRINFAGNATTPEETMRREILVKEGDVFNASLWNLSLARLNQLGLFEEIKIEDARITPIPNEPKVDIDLRLKEKDR